MNKQEFEELLKKANLTINEFAKIFGINPQSVRNWSVKGYPYWVKPFIENYIKAKRFESAKKALCDELVKRDDE